MICPGAKVSFVIDFPAAAKVSFAPGHKDTLRPALKSLYSWKFLQRLKYLLDGTRRSLKSLLARAKVSLSPGPVDVRKSIFNLREIKSLLLELKKMDI